LAHDLWNLTRERFRLSRCQKNGIRRAVRANPLEDPQRLPQQGLGPGGVADGQGTPALAGQRVRLIPRAADLASQVQGLLVAGSSLAQVPAEPSQDTEFVEDIHLSALVADVTVDGQRVGQILGRCGAPRRTPRLSRRKRYR